MRSYRVTCGSSIFTSRFLLVFRSQLEFVLWWCVANPTFVNDNKVHIQIPPTGYVGIILRSTAVATVSQNTVEGYSDMLSIFEGFFCFVLFCLVFVCLFVLIIHRSFLQRYRKKKQTFEKDRSEQKQFKVMILVI